VVSAGAVVSTGAPQAQSRRQSAATAQSSRFIGILLSVDSNSMITDLGPVVILKILKEISRRMEKSVPQYQTPIILYKP
jgi:hypothetical protein